MNLDQFNNFPINRGGPSAMRVISSVQDLPAPAQAVGIATAFRLMCEHYGLNINDVLYATANMMADSEGRKPEFSAVARYMREEWK